jgi:hypothetical protein
MIKEFIANIKMKSMKKTIAVLLLMGSAAAVNAQDTLNGDMNNDPQRLEMTGSYHAKATTSVPSHLQSNFTLAYPNATDVTWYEMNDNWYRAVHNQDGRTLHMYYAPNGLSYMVALPVIQSWVPEEVISTAIDRYGDNIYAVNKVKVAGNVDAYQVSILENGQLRYEWIGTDGTAITDVFRTDMDNMASGTLQTSGNYAGKEDVKVKTKVEKADGTEVKTKTKNGKTKTKTDNY